MSLLDYFVKLCKVFLARFSFFLNFITHRKKWNKILIHKITFEISTLKAFLFNTIIYLETIELMSENFTRKTFFYY